MKFDSHEIQKNGFIKSIDGAIGFEMRGGVSLIYSMEYAGVGARGARMRGSPLPIEGNVGGRCHFDPLFPWKKIRKKKRSE